MGILSRPEEEETVIQIDKPTSMAKFFAVNKQPYTIGKLAKLRHGDAEDLIAKSQTVNYYIGQVPGFNIFFIHAGFDQPPDHIVSDAEIKSNIDEICDWFLHHYVLGNNKTIRKFKIK